MKVYGDNTLFTWYFTIWLLCANSAIWVEYKNTPNLEFSNVYDDLGNTVVLVEYESIRQYPTIPKDDGILMIMFSVLWWKDYNTLICLEYKIIRIQQYIDMVLEYS